MGRAIELRKVAQQDADSLTVVEEAPNGARSEQWLFESPEPKIAMDWSHDGRYILFGSRSPKTVYDIWALPTEGDRTPFLVAGTQFDEEQGRFSADSRWVAYSSDASGRREVYVRKVMIGGRKPTLGACPALPLFFVTLFSSWASTSAGTGRLKPIIAFLRILETPRQLV